VKKVALNTGCQVNPVYISGDGVVLEYVAGIGRRNEPNSKVDDLRAVTIPTDPVRTEPVATSAAGQSYAAARVGEVTIAYGNVAVQQVV
jgi:hypothetical protein